MKDNRQLLEVLKARMKESKGKTITQVRMPSLLMEKLKAAREKAIAEGKPIPSFKNPLIERMKAAREKAIAEGKAIPRPQMPNKMSEILKKMRETANNNI